MRSEGKEFSQLCRLIWDVNFNFEKQEKYLKDNLENILFVAAMTMTLKKEGGGRVQVHGAIGLSLNSWGNADLI